MRDSARLSVTARGPSGRWGWPARTYHGQLPGLFLGGF